MLSNTEPLSCLTNHALSVETSEGLTPSSKQLWTWGLKVIHGCVIAFYLVLADGKVKVVLLSVEWVCSLGIGDFETGFNCTAATLVGVGWRLQVMPVEGGEAEVVPVEPEGPLTG